MAPFFQPTKGQLINTGEIEAVGTVKAKDSAIQGIKRGNLDSRAVRAFPHVVNADSLAPGVGGIELQAIRNPSRSCSGQDCRQCWRHHWKSRAPRFAESHLVSGPQEPGSLDQSE